MKAKKKDKVELNSDKPAGKENPRSCILQTVCRDEEVHIRPPNFKFGEVWINGTAPLVIHRFADKGGIMEKQAAGSTANSKRERKAKDFTKKFNDARHISHEGWDGIPASAFRNACIRACTLVGFKMTQAKMSIFFGADGYDREEGSPLVRIIGEEPRQLDAAVRLPNGAIDICSRPQWLEWGARLRVKYDADQFTASDVGNLIARAGMQVGICEGRPSSSNSNGCGWGTFELSDEETVMKLAKKGGAK